MGDPWNALLLLSQVLSYSFATPWTDCSPPGSSVYGICQARILEWVAISYCRGSSWPRDWTYISCIGRRILYRWITRGISHKLYVYLPSLLNLPSFPYHPLGGHRTPDWTPRVTQWLPTSSLFYTWLYVYVSATCSLHLILLFPSVSASLLRLIIKI